MNPKKLGGFYYLVEMGEMMMKNLSLIKEEKKEDEEEVVRI
jgi:hypothetical protein